MSATATYSAPTMQVLPKRRRKVVRAELGGDFAGFWLDVWVNPKRAMLRVFSGGDEVRTDEGLAALVVDHNLTGEDGEPYPSPLTLAALDDMEMDLYGQVVSAVAESMSAANTLPKAPSEPSASGS